MGTGLPAAALLRCLWLAAVGGGELLDLAYPQRDATYKHLGIIPFRDLVSARDAPGSHFSCERAVRLEEPAPPPPEAAWRGRAAGSAANATGAATTAADVGIGYMMRSLTSARASAAPLFFGRL